MENIHLTHLGYLNQAKIGYYGNQPLFITENNGEKHVFIACGDIATDTKVAANIAVYAISTYHRNVLFGVVAKYPSTNVHRYGNAIKNQIACMQILQKPQTVKEIAAAVIQQQTAWDNKIAAKIAAQQAAETARKEAAQKAVVLKQQAAIKAAKKLQLEAAKYHEGETVLLRETLEDIHIIKINADFTLQCKNSRGDTIRVNLAEITTVEDKQKDFFNKIVYKDLNRPLTAEETAQLPPKISKRQFKKLSKIVKEYKGPRMAIYTPAELAALEAEEAIEEIESSVDPQEYGDYDRYYEER